MAALLRSLTPKRAIPRIIHQVWFQIGDGPAAPPAEYTAMRESWRALHPGWQFMDWDLAKSRALLRKHYPRFLPLFDRYKRDIFRIDSIRYFVLHHYGGFYVDTDVTCLRSIEELCSVSTRRAAGSPVPEVVLALNRYTKDSMPLYNNHFMGSVAGATFFRECIDRLPLTATLVQTEKHSYTSTMLTAGPLFLTTIASFQRKHGRIHTLSYQEEVTLFTHHEKHSWQLTRSIIGDVARMTGFVTALTLGGIVLKKALVVKDVGAG